MFKRYIALFWMMLRAVVHLSGAETDRCCFTHITSGNSDLPYDTVNEIVQDKYGFIWIGTSSGICRFDGVRFKSWYKDDMGLNSGFVIAVCPDDDGNIWVGTENGLAVYSAHLDCFRPFLKESDKGTSICNRVNCICKDRHGRIWMSVNRQGLFCYDSKSGSLMNYFCEDGAQTLPVNIRTFCVDNDGNVWISLYYNGIYLADRDMTSLAPVLRGSSADFFKNDDIIAISRSPERGNTIYVAAVSKGLCCIDMADRTVRTIIPAQDDCVPESLFIDKSKRVWMATTGGVYCYDIVTQKKKLYVSSKDDPFSLSDSHAFSVYVDSRDGLWVGTNVGGVNYSGVFQRNFEKCYMTDGESLDDCLVRGFADDGNGTIWVTTEKNGLLRYDSSAGILEKYVHPGIPVTLFAALYDNGSLWLGSLKGLYRLDTATGSLKVWNTLKSSANIVDSKIYSIYRTRSGNILVGTTVGLYKYDSGHETFDAVEGFDGIFVTDMDEDGNGSLWISTYADGIIEYDLVHEKVAARYVHSPEDPYSVPSGKIFSILAASDGDVWATSFADGFCRLDCETRQFRTYDMARCDVLPSDIYFKIVEDDGGNLWVSSAKGLLRFDPETGNICRYTVSEGLLDDEFKNCGIKTLNGDLYLGSRNGFIRFNPERFVKEGGSRRLVITDFRIGDESVSAAADGSPLKCNVNDTGKIELSSKQNSFGFGFAVLGAVSPGTNAVMCMLDGYDNDWRRVDENNSIFYYNVPAGSYRLKMKVSSGGNTWDEPHDGIEIVVAQRFYKSTVAILLYFIILAAVIGTVFFSFYSRALKKEKLRMERQKKAREEELFHEKMNFFSNIVHEIKTPLTLIKTPLRNILATCPSGEAIQEDLAVISNSTDYLDSLVKELLEFIRIEEYGYVLECRNIDIVEKLDFLCSNFTETAKSRNIDMRFVHDDGHVWINADEKAIDKILNNLLHNAVKYAESWISVSVEVKDGIAVLSFRNDGPVIPAGRREEIFKPFVQYGNELHPYSQSFGIGLPLARTLAEKHSGTLMLSPADDCTEFILALPVRLMVPENAAEESSGLIAANGQKAILIVEDNIDLASYLKRKLGEEYGVTAAGTAEQALRLLGQYDFDMLVTDIALAGMSGIELCRRVSTDVELSHIPIIVLSAISSVDTKIACMESGASLYIEKPFTLDYLQACMRSIMEKRDRLRKSWRSPMSSIDSSQFELHSSDEEFLRRLDEITMKNLHDPEFSSRHLEEQLFMSRSTLIRKIKALLDTTPNDWIRSKRLEVAAGLLEQNRCRISEVCYAVGFNSPSYFAKCFKAQFGMLPADWRKEGGRS